MSKSLGPFPFSSTARTQLHVWRRTGESFRKSSPPHVLERKLAGSIRTGEQKYDPLTRNSQTIPLKILVATFRQSAIPYKKNRWTNVVCLCTLCLSLSVVFIQI